MMPASAVCSPVPVTSTRSEPEPFTVPAITLSPVALSTGRDSPVIIDSLTALVAVAHDAIRRNARAGAHEHEVAVAQLHRAGRPPCARRRSAARAVFGSSFASSFSAPCACEIERISIQWPSSMIVTSVASSSQSGMPGIAERHGGAEHERHVIASAISVIIPGRRSSQLALSRPG